MSVIFDIYRSGFSMGLASVPRSYGYVFLYAFLRGRCSQNQCSNDCDDDVC